MIVNKTRLNKKISLLKDNKVSDGYGGYIDGVVTEIPLRAEVLPTSAIETFKRQQLQQDTTHIVTIRYRKDICNSDLIKHNDKILDIKSIVNLEGADRYLEIMCVERGD